MLITNTSLQMKLFLLSLFITASLVVSCGKRDPAPDAVAKAQTGEQSHTVELTAEQVQLADIQFGNVEMRAMSNVIAANGMLDAPPQNVIAVSPRLGGFVKSTPLLEGLHVRKGQTLAVLEHQDFITLQQEYLENFYRLDVAEAEQQRQAELSRENITALKTFQQITADYRALKARTAALEQRLHLVGINAEHLRKTSTLRPAYTITAPIDGYVTQVNVTLGKFVVPGEVLCRIVNTAHLHAEIQVFEKDAPMLREGQHVRVMLVNEAMERLGKVFLIGREISAERSVRVHVHFDKEDTKLLPNTALKAAIELDAHTVPTVPDAAVVSMGSKEYIFVVEKSHYPKEHSHNDPHTEFRMIEVRKGSSAQGFTEIFLPADVNTSTVNIVVKGAYSLLAAFQHAQEGGGEGHEH